MKKRTEDLGFDLTREELDVVYDQFTLLADKKKGVRNEEIATIVRGILASGTAANPALPETTTVR